MLDGGKGMIETLNAVPVTHMCFGNHENDVPLQQLVSRCGEYEGKWINSNMYDEVVGRELVCVWCVWGASPCSKKEYFAGV